MFRHTEKNKQIKNTVNVFNSQIMQTMKKEKKKEDIHTGLLLMDSRNMSRMNACELLTKPFNDLHKNALKKFNE